MCTLCVAPLGHLAVRETKREASAFKTETIEVRRYPECELQTSDQNKTPNETRTELLLCDTVLEVQAENFKNSQPDCKAYRLSSRDLASILVPKRFEYLEVANFEEADHLPVFGANEDVAKTKPNLFHFWSFLKFQIQALQLESGKLSLPNPLLNAKFSN